jgi:hypothetical protein
MSFWPLGDPTLTWGLLLGSRDHSFTALCHDLASALCHSYLDIIEQAISAGDVLLIENIGETVEPVLDPLLGRNTIKKGR